TARCRESLDLIHHTHFAGNDALETKRGEFRKDLLLVDDTAPCAVAPRYEEPARRLLRLDQEVREPPAYPPYPFGDRAAADMQGGHEYPPAFDHCIALDLDEPLCGLAQ